MSCTEQFSPKSANDQLTLTFDFTPSLDAGETLASLQGTPSVTVEAGVDAAPDILNGTAQLGNSNTAVLVPVKGGVPGCYYLIEVTCNTSTNRRLTLPALLPVLAY